MLLILFLSAFLVFEEVAALHVSNLNETCLRCLCHVAGCDLGHSCTDGYCGPFYISRVYWVDAGKPTLPEDSPERKEAYEDCARDFYCSMKIVEGYMAKFGKDCNEDGVTDCFDYMMINHHGSTCSEPLHLTPLGRRRLRLFQQCRLTN
ncbi:uncharacterized protein LOC116771398 [Danaus plexippus]|uniref:uncharacterized protein LOC116771398 n=1 Tax=Danaus plexippus TaxID=13037 RepID=UPI00023A0231|nr:uncharacterized protein LOC116771398 [Danaus plexippus]